MKRAILYARVSTPRQAELYSLDYQIEQERSYVASVGLSVVAELRDDQSGRKIERDGLEEACQMLERNEADVLVTWKFDRLHRNYVNSVLLRDRIRRAGKEIHYAQTRQVSGKTARERLPEDLQFIMAEIDADTIAENTLNGKINKAKAGKWVGHNRPPYGYKVIGKGRDAYLVVEPAQAMVVRDIFTWYVVGEPEVGPLSTRQIAERLTAQGVPTPTDTLNRPKKRGFAEWSRATVHKIIRQQAYSGVIMQYGYPCPVPQLVATDIFQAAQRKMDQGREISSRGAQFEYLFGRRIWCQCGYKMRSTSTGRAHMRADGTIKDYTYHVYRCPGRSRDNAKPCTMPYIPVDRLDARVWQWVKEEIANPLILERKLRDIQAEQQTDHEAVTDRLAALQRHKETIETELRTLGRLYATDMPRHIVEGLISEENHKLQLTLDEIARVTEEAATPLTDEVIASLSEFSYMLGEHLQAIEAHYDAKRVVVDGLDVRVTVIQQGSELFLELQCILRDDVVSIPFSRTDFSRSWNKEKSARVVVVPWKTVVPFALTL